VRGRREHPYRPGSLQGVPLFLEDGPGGPGLSLTAAVFAGAAAIAGPVWDMTASLGDAAQTGARGSRSRRGGDRKHRRAHGRDGASPGRDGTSSPGRRRSSREDSVDHIVVQLGQGCPYGAYPHAGALTLVLAHLLHAPSLCAAVGNALAHAVDRRVWAHILVHRYVSSFFFFFIFLSKTLIFYFFYLPQTQCRLTARNAVLDPTWLERTVRHTVRGGIARAAVHKLSDGAYDFFFVKIQLQEYNCETHQNTHLQTPRLVRCRRGGNAPADVLCERTSQCGRAAGRRDGLGGLDRGGIPRHDGW
jgi:hypothetical protein